MDLCLRRGVAIEKFSHISTVDCELNTITKGQQIPSPKGVICPKPRRAIVVPSIPDSCCTQKSNSLTWKCDAGLDVIDIFLLNKNESQDFDAAGSMNFFCGSPPTRTSNPLIHDTQFSNQKPSLPLLPIENNTDSGTLMTRLERVTTSCANGRPMLRVEGFSARSSISALA